MITENLSTLKINKLTQAQYNRELSAGNINENELYLTPDSSNTMFTNALKGSKSGEGVSLTDISPLEHELDIKIGGVEDFSSVEVYQYGKNLYNYNTDIAQQLNSKHENGVFTQLITDPREYFSFIVQKYLDNTYIGYIPNGAETKIYEPTVVIKSFKKTSDFNRLRLGHNGANKNCMCIIDISRLVDGETYTLQVNITSTTPGSLSWQDIQIEPGAIATEYEACKEPVIYYPNDDGTVNGIVGDGKSMTLTTNTSGAVIDVKYNRDINKAFAELQQAIISTGGTI